MKPTTARDLAAVCLREISRPITAQERSQMAYKRIMDVASDTSKPLAERVKEIALRIHLMQSPI